MGFFNKKKRATVVASPISKEPLSGGSRHSGFALSLPDLEKKDYTYKKSIRVLRFIARLFSLIFNVLMISVLTYALYQYFTTRNRTVPINPPTSPWLNPATLWPTFVLLGIAVVTFFMNLFTLIAYCCGIGAANRVNNCSTVIQYIFLGVHVVVWAVAAGAYKMGSDGRDLWGYSCSDQADNIQDEVKSFLDFGKLCASQTGAWYLSIIEAATYLLTFIITILAIRRASHKKRLSKIRESMNMETGYDRVEMDSMHKQGRRYMPLAGESPSLR